MGAIDWRNMSLRILSVLLAILLWVYANNEQNPVYNQILSINLHQRGLSQGMIVGGNIPQNVNIRVQGTRAQVSALTPADFDAYLDMSGIGDGEHSVLVKVNSPPGVQVTVTPPRVYVTVDRIVDQQVQVAATLKGSPARGYTTLDPVIQPSTVTLRGPRSKISAIDRLNLSVDVEGATNQVEKVLPLTVPQGVSVYPQTVKVTVPVTQLPVKTVSVRAMTTGEPASGYQEEGDNVSPVRVQVMAPTDVLAGIESLDTEKIDITGADRDVTVKTALVLPPGVVEISPSSVEVTVHIIKKAQPPASGDSATTQ